MTITADVIPAGYDARSVVAVPRQNGTLYDLVHEATGARFVHLAVLDRNSSFCVLYRTPPPDSTGVPHIMEHCVSGGSRRFPPGAGGDMYNRSLLTDINGMTQADNTTYYFATRNPIDYMNWLEYVVDVSLFPRLEVDTFLKHRGHLEFGDDGKLRFVGTVFNEMKAVFGSPRHHEFLALRKALYDGTHPYANYAGGDPAEMPSLTYEQLRAFNHAHYHPGNATFISRGDVPLDRILEATQGIVGDGFEKRAPSDIPDIVRRRQPTRLEAPMHAGDGQTTLAWVTSPSTDPYRRLLLELANDLLLAHDTTSLVMPLRRIVVTATTTGIDESFESRVLELLNGGVSDGALRDAVAQIEARRSEQANALGTFLDAVLPGVLYDGDTADALNLDPTRANVADLKQVVRQELIDNAHRALITLHPDPTLEDSVRETEQAWLATLERELTAERREEIVAETARLATPVTADFPRRGLTLEEGLSILDAPGASSTHGPVTFYEQPTGGLAYLRLRIDLSGLDMERVPSLRLFADAISRADGVTAEVHTRVDATATRCIHWLEIGLRALDRDTSRLLDEARTALGTRTTDDDDVARARTNLERSVMPDAQTHLRRLAASSLRRSARLDDLVRGLSQRPTIAAFDDLITSGRITACVIGSSGEIADDVAAMITSLPAEDEPRPPDDVLDGDRPHRARVAQLPVAFTCKAFRIGGLDDPDVAPIAVLTQRMWAGYLNTEIRRGGAYGIDFGVLPGRGLLWISSRRDPLPDNTYRAIDETIRRVADGSFDGPGADDAKLAILRTTDPVDSPAAAARRAWIATFTGQTTDKWNAYRRRVLEVTDADTERVARMLIGQGSKATLAGRVLLDETGPYDEIEEI
jgi:Zn-dependent M16 (insulinase) family peptidase